MKDYMLFYIYIYNFKIMIFLNIDFVNYLDNKSPLYFLYLLIEEVTYKEKI